MANLIHFVDNMDAEEILSNGEDNKVIQSYFDVDMEEVQ